MLSGTLLGILQISSSINHIATMTNRQLSVSASAVKVQNDVGFLNYD